MRDGLVASLTSDEEMTFQRIANAGSREKLLRPQDLERLRDLGLVKGQRVNGGRIVKLTDLGKMRFGANVFGNGSMR